MLDRLVKRHGFALSDDDQRSIEYVYRAFFSEGPDLRYSFPRQQFGARWFPNYAELMTATDLTGFNHSYVATEDNFRALRDFQRNNLLVPIVGDFGGEKAIRAVGSYLREHGATVNYFYTSNVEQYLFQSDAWQQLLHQRRHAAARRATARSSARTSTWASAIPPGIITPDLHSVQLLDPDREPARGLQGRRIQDLRRAGGPHEVLTDRPPRVFLPLPSSLCYVPPMKATVISALVSLGVSVSAFAAPTGEEVYRTRCSTCHEQSTPRIPHREALQKMPAVRILRALDSGAMMSIAFVMSRDDRIAVASYLGTRDTIVGPSPAAFCSTRTVTIAASPTGWNGWSPGANNARFQPGEQAGLTIDQVKRLRLKWAFGFEGDVTAYAQPAVLVDICSSAAPAAPSRRCAPKTDAWSGPSRPMVPSERRSSRRRSGTGMRCCLAT